MPRKSKKEVIRCLHFTWRVYKRKGVWQADGRSNTLNAGSHSLGTQNHETALERLQELDAIRAFDLGLIARLSLVTTHDAKLPLKEGRQKYEEYVNRPTIAGGIRKSSAQRYSAILDKFLTFCREEHVEHWVQVDAKLLLQIHHPLGKQKLRMKNNLHRRQHN